MSQKTPSPAMSLRTDSSHVSQQSSQPVSTHKSSSLQSSHKASSPRGSYNYKSNAYSQTSSYQPIQPLRGRGPTTTSSGYGYGPNTAIVPTAPAVAPVAAAPNAVSPLCCPTSLGFGWNPLCGGFALNYNRAPPQPKKITVIRNSYPGTGPACYPPQPSYSPCYSPYGSCYQPQPQCGYPQYYTCPPACQPQAAPQIVIDPNICKGPTTYTYYRQSNLASEMSPEMNCMLGRVLNAVNLETNSPCQQQQQPAYVIPAKAPEEKRIQHVHRPPKPHKSRATSYSYPSYSTSYSSYSTEHSSSASEDVILPRRSSRGTVHGEHWHVKTFDYVKDKHHKGKHGKDRGKSSSRKPPKKDKYKKDDTRRRTTHSDSGSGTTSDSDGSRHKDHGHKKGDKKKDKQPKGSRSRVKESKSRGKSRDKDKGKGKDKDKGRSKHKNDKDKDKGRSKSKDKKGREKDDKKKSKNKSRNEPPLTSPQRQNSNRKISFQEDPSTFNPEEFTVNPDEEFTVNPDEEFTVNPEESTVIPEESVNAVYENVGIMDDVTPPKKDSIEEMNRLKGDMIAIGSNMEIIQLFVPDPDKRDSDAGESKTEPAARKNSSLSRRNSSRKGSSPHRHSSPRKGSSPRRHSSPRKKESPSRRHSSPRKGSSPHRYSSPRKGSSPHRYSSPRKGSSPRRHSSPRKKVSPSRRHSSPRKESSSRRNSSPKRKQSTPSRVHSDHRNILKDDFDAKYKNRLAHKPDDKDFFSKLQKIDSGRTRSRSRGGQTIASSNSSNSSDRRRRKAMDINGGRKLSVFKTIDNFRKHSLDGKISPKNGPTGAPKKMEGIKAGSGSDTDDNQKGKGH